MAAGSTFTLGGTNTIGSSTTTWSATTTMSGVITVSGSGAKIRTASSGRLELGDNDWVTFSTARTRAVRWCLSPMNAQWNVSSDATFSTDAPGLTIVTKGITISIIVQPLHNGATISSVDVYFTPRTGTAAAPATTPSIAMYRRAIATGAAVGAQTALSGTAVQSYTAGGDYWDGKVKIMTYTASTNNVVDTSTYVYYLFVVDESGANSAAGNIYHAIVVNYSAIADMRFQ